MMSSLEHLPGGELIAQGLEDCAAGRITRHHASSLWVGPG